MKQVFVTLLIASIPVLVLLVGADRLSLIREDIIKRYVTNPTTELGEGQQIQIESIKPVAPVALAAPAVSVDAVTLRVNHELDAPNVRQTPKQSWRNLLVKKLRSGIANLREHTTQIVRKLFRVSRISVVGNYHLSESEVRDAFGLEQGAWAWEIPFSSGQTRARRQPWITSIGVKWSFYPLGGEITIREEEPWIVAEFSGMSWLVARSGRVLQPLDSLEDPDLIVKSSELPRLDGLGAIVGEDSSLTGANKRFISAVEVIRIFELAGSFPFPVERYTVQTEESGLLVRSSYPRKYPSLLVDAASYQQAITTLQNLQMVMTNLAERNETPKLVDLRFSGQVVVKEWK